MSQTKPALDLVRVAEQTNIILTEIYGRYVEKGSPTKLGGLRFLDVESAKTFAFEKTVVAPDNAGNLLMLSAPFSDNKEDVETRLKAGPHGELLRDVEVRTSPDVGKKNKYFVESSYFLDTINWLTDENILLKIKAHGCTGNEAIVRILKEKVLPIAADIMENFIAIVRAETTTIPVHNPLG